MKLPWKFGGARFSRRADLGVIFETRRTTAPASSSGGAAGQPGAELFGSSPAAHQICHDGRRAESGCRPGRSTTHTHGSIDPTASARIARRASKVALAGGRAPHSGQSRKALRVQHQQSAPSSIEYQVTWCEVPTSIIARLMHPSPVHDQPGQPSRSSLRRTRLAAEGAASGSGAVPRSRRTGTDRDPRPRPGSGEGVEARLGGRGVASCRRSLNSSSRRRSRPGLGVPVPNA